MTVYPQEFRGNNTANSILAGIITPQAVASLIVCCRFYSRYLIRAWGWDDTVIAVAWLLSLATVTLVGVETRYGLGRHHSDIPIRYSNKAIEISYATIICYQLALLATKFSILFFYLRILKLAFQRRLIFVTMGFVFVMGAVLIPFSALICNPLTGQRDLAIGRCYKYYPMMTASAILHASVDLWLIGLITPYILQMTLPKKQKIGLAFVLGLGLFDACASLTRVAISYRFLNPKLAQWDSLSFAIWTTLEVSLGVICASIPMLRPLVRQVRGQKPSSTPDIARNVARSKNAKPVRSEDGSLFSMGGADVEMAETSILEESRLLKQHVVVDIESVRSGSVSNDGTNHSPMTSNV